MAEQQLDRSRAVVGGSCGADRFQQHVEQLPRKGVRQLRRQAQLLRVQLLRVDGGGGRVEERQHLVGVEMVGTPRGDGDLQRDAAKGGKERFSGGRGGDVGEVGFVGGSNQARESNQLYGKPFDSEWLEGLGWWPDVGRVLAGWWGVSQPELTLLSLSLLISPLVEATKFGNPSGSRFTVQGAF